MLRLGETKRRGVHPAEGVWKTVVASPAHRACAQSGRRRPEEAQTRARAVAHHGAAEASPVAPELCVEVLSTSNTAAEIDEKRRLYFERGAVEVWTCGVEGDMHFYDSSGELPSSRLVPDFPKHVEL